MRGKDRCERRKDDAVRVEGIEKVASEFCFPRKEENVKSIRKWEKHVSQIKRSMVRRFLIDRWSKNSIFDRKYMRGGYSTISNMSPKKLHRFYQIQHLMSTKEYCLLLSSGQV